MSHHSHCIPVVAFFVLAPLYFRIWRSDILLWHYFDRYKLICFWLVWSDLFAFSRNMTFFIVYNFPHESVWIHDMIYISCVFCAYIHEKSVAWNFDLQIPVFHQWHAFWSVSSINFLLNFVQLQQDTVPHLHFMVNNTRLCTWFSF